MQNKQSQTEPTLLDIDGASGTSLFGTLVFDLRWHLKNVWLCAQSTNLTKVSGMSGISVSTVQTVR